MFEFVGPFAHSRCKEVNPSNAKATFVQNTRTQRFLKIPLKPCLAGIHWKAQ